MVEGGQDLDVLRRQGGETRGRAAGGGQRSLRGDDRGEDGGFQAWR